MKAKFKFLCLGVFFAKEFPLKGAFYFQNYHLSVIHACFSLRCKFYRN